MTHADAAPLPPAQPTPRRRWPWFVRLLVAGGVLLVAIAGLIVATYVIENARGEARWRKFQQDALARGEKLTTDEIRPKPVPDEENFARTPFLVPLLDYDRATPGKWRDPAGHERARALNTPFDKAGSVKVPSTGKWELGLFVSVEEWQEYFEAHPEFGPVEGQAKPGNGRKAAGQAVLATLKRYDPVLDELKEASRRPASVFPIHYEESFNALLPHLATLKGVSGIVQLRAAAQLAAGQTNAALEDVLFGFRLADSLRTEPLLISQLVRLAMLHRALQPVWEGLARHEWSDHHLTEIQAALGRISLTESYQLAIRGERAFGNTLFDQLRRGQLNQRDLDGLELPVPAPVKPLIPSGWLYQNQATINLVYQDALLPVADPSAHRFFPDKARNAENHPSLQGRSPYNLLAKLLIPAVTKSGLRFAHVQTGIDLAFTACALERHHLARGSYPERLETLVPAFSSRLPNDLISGEPLRYNRPQPGSFTLYSVGWNQQDDQGEPGRNPRSTAGVPEQGDWVWNRPDAF